MIGSYPIVNIWQLWLIGREKTISEVELKPKRLFVKAFAKTAETSADRT